MYNKSQNEASFAEKNPTWEWIKAHKVELLIGAGTVVGAVILVRNWSTVVKMFKPCKSAAPKLPIAKPVAEKVVAPLVTEEFLGNLTGKRLTARGLGDKVWYSAQEINKRIVAHGLAERLPCGEYTLTDAGKLVGEYTLKTTRAGHTFRNIEWEEKILELLFSPEELKAIADRQALAKSILAA